MEDEEQVVFNAMVKEDEMIINIEEYKEMSKKIKDNEAKETMYWKTRSNYINENMELKQHLEKVENENQSLKIGIINVVKILGGQNGQIR